MNNASTLNESAAATKQGEFIRLLTLMTVVCCFMDLNAIHEMCS